MNVLDPLQPLNNLGRSVSKASHMRIVAALQHVCRSAKQLLQDMVRSRILVATLYSVVGKEACRAPACYTGARTTCIISARLGDPH
jgi:hypothetical protein